MRAAWIAPVLVLSFSVPAGSAPERPYAVSEERAGCDAYDPLRHPFFGDLHVHTALSFDAASQDTRKRPADAYRFARGAPLDIQPYDEQGRGMRVVRLDRPLDFVAVTDHAELLGEVHACLTRGVAGYWHPACFIYRHFPRFALRLFGWRTMTGKGRWGFCGDEGAHCRELARGAWDEVRAAAEQAYDRSAACRFTSFVGYEWTGTVGHGKNLHRNVIFRNAVVPPIPMSWVETPSAVDLWDHLERDCTEAGTGCDALTIPHNSNLSSGLMFRTARIREDGIPGPLDADEARRRQRWEPLFEVMQHKGDSECDVRAGWETDEACGWEKLPYDRFAGQLAFYRKTLPNEASYLRWALARGLVHQRELGTNPFRYGLIAATDTHIAAPGLTAEKGHPGHGGAGRGARDGVGEGFSDELEFNPGGLTVLYAEENTRDALFAAMRRREAYGTSGPRPLVRFFGGWDYAEDLCDAPDFVARGYAGGVPMGGELPPSGVGDVPRFAVSAHKDPGGASEPSVPLQRVQIIKGWLEGGEPRERVIDVAGGDNAASVDLATCERRGDGAAQLCTVWSDPDFDPAAPAFYYVRVLENPTCRWSQYVCNDAGVDCDDPRSVPKALAGCCAAEHRPVQQERAWTSPIWYNPD